MKIQNQIPSPQLLIPEPLRGLESGTWAHKTIATRLPDIARRVITENEFNTETINKINQFIQEIHNGYVRPIDTPLAKDNDLWKTIISPHLGKTWLEIPWFFAEFYFYRRILEATGYFHPDAGQNQDPYAYQKQQGLEISRQAIHSLCRQTNQWLEQPEQKFEHLRQFLGLNLWGNQADLSLWPADENEQSDPVNRDRSMNTIIDHTPRILKHLSVPDFKPGRIDFVVDNAGFELVCDLALVDFLLQSNLVSVVHMHAKAFPIFVSDALPEDILQTIKKLEDSADEDTHQVGSRLQNLLETKRLQIQADPYWTTPLSFWELTPQLRKNLSGAHLVFFKGDANYRRLLGDRHWQNTDRFADILSHFEIPVVALRVLKSEVVAGLKPGHAEQIKQQDPQWMTNGQWGMIQTSL